MNQSIVIREYGGPDVLKVEDHPINIPKNHEILIRHTGIGINYHDIYVRSGFYQTLKIPGTPGCEGVGVIEEVGSEVENLNVGDRIVYISSEYGAYSNYRLLNSDLAIKVHQNIPDSLLSTSFLRAMTVDMLLNQVAQVDLIQTMIVTGASGGVGRILCQWASKSGIKWFVETGTLGNYSKC